MRSAFILAVVMSALVGCASARATQSKPLWVDDRPAPVAYEGEPPVAVTNGRYDTDRRFYSQQFPDAGAHSVTPVDAPIANHYYAFAGRTESLPATSIPVTCRIGHSGHIPVSSCTAKDGLTDDQNLTMRLVRAWSEGIDFPRYNARLTEEQPLSRRVDMVLEVPEIPAPKVDLSSGPLVETSLIDMPLNTYAGSHYPSRALRKELEGLMTVECQIQIDLSVICRQLSFEPAENASAFRNAERRIFRRATPKAQLKDGTDARGVRFQSQLKFQLAQ